MRDFYTEKMNFGSAFGQPQGNVNPNNDYECQPAPDDTISSLSWSPNNMHFIAGAWDGLYSIHCVLLTTVQGKYVFGQLQTLELK